MGGLPQRNLTKMGALVKPLLCLCDAIALVALAVLFGVVAVNALDRHLPDLAPKGAEGRFMTQPV